MSRAEDHLDELVVASGDFRRELTRASDWGERLAGVLPAGGRLLAAGNGGSAAQAQHLTAELVGRYHAERPPMSAICLSAETSTLTALVNDYAAEELFARQVDAHGRAGDVLTLFSTSGSSPNVLAAAARGRERGLTVWAFTGLRPNPLADLAAETVAVPVASTATVQELHLVGLHVLCEAFDAALGVRTPTGRQAGAADGRAHCAADAPVDGPVGGRATERVAGVTE